MHFISLARFMLGAIVLASSPLVKSQVRVDPNSSGFTSFVVNGGGFPIRQNQFQIQFRPRQSSVFTSTTVSQSQFDPNNVAGFPPRNSVFDSSSGNSFPPRNSQFERVIGATFPTRNTEFITTVQRNSEFEQSRPNASPTDFRQQRTRQQFEQRQTSQQFEQRATQQFDQRPTQQFDQRPTQQFDQWPTQHFEQKPTQQFEQRPTQQFEQRPVQQFEQRPTQQFEQRPVQQFEQRPTQQFEQRPVQQFEQRPTQQFEQRPTQQFEQRPTQQFEQPPTQQFEQRPKQQFEQRPTQQQPTQASVQQVQQPEAESVSMTESCLACICEASTNCQLATRCVSSGQYCGPFLISKPYWMDAGRPTLLQDSPDREGAFSDCAEDPVCAAQTVRNYMTKYKKDCNGDGIVDCDDLARIHLMGPFGTECASPNVPSTRFYTKFSKCWSTVKQLS